MSTTPADSRAYATLIHMINPFLEQLQESSDKTGINRAILTKLPFGIAYSTELKIAVREQHQKFTLEDRKGQVRRIAIDIIQNLIIHTLPYDMYTRDDVIRWYNSDPAYTKYFSSPADEFITVTIKRQTQTTTKRLQLSEEQIMGIAYGRWSFRYRSTPVIKVISSITNKPVEFDQLVHNSSRYSHRQFQQPYQVTILPDPTIPNLAQDNPKIVYFNQPEFMQGVLSVAAWFHLLDKGKDTLWKDVKKYTPDGLVSVSVE